MWYKDFSELGEEVFSASLKRGNQPNQWSMNLRNIQVFVNDKRCYSASLLICFKYHKEKLPKGTYMKIS